MNGLLVFSSSFRIDLPERERGNAAGVFFPKLPETTADGSERELSRRAVTAAGARSGGPRYLSYLQNVENGALRPSPQLLSEDRVMPP
jgi:hypothetical protein